MQRGQKNAPRGRGRCRIGAYQRKFSAFVDKLYNIILTKFLSLGEALSFFCKVGVSRLFGI
jgi:hypothetical protein